MSGNEFQEYSRISSKSGDHLPHFVKGQATALVGGFDPTINCGQCLGINLDFFGHRNLEPKVVHTIRVAWIGK